MYVPTCTVTSGVAEPTWCDTMGLLLAVSCWALAAVASVPARECNPATAAKATAAGTYTFEHRQPFTIERIVNSLFTADKFTEKDLPENARFSEDDMNSNPDDRLLCERWNNAGDGLSM